MPIPPLRTTRYTLPGTYGALWRQRRPGGDERSSTQSGESPGRDAQFMGCRGTRGFAVALWPCALPRAVSTPPSPRFARVSFWPQWHSKNVRCDRQPSSQPRRTSASPHSPHQRTMRPEHSMKRPDPANDCMYPPVLFEPWQTLSSHIGAAGTR